MVSGMSKHSADSRGHYSLVADDPMSATTLESLAHSIRSLWPGAEMEPHRLNGREVVRFRLPAAEVEARATSTPVDDFADVEDLGAGTEVRLLTVEDAEVAAPEEALNIIAGYCLAVQESLPDGVTSVTQDVAVPGGEQFRLTLAPVEGDAGPVAASWEEGTGWVVREGANAEALTADRSRRREQEAILRSLLGMKSVPRSMRDRIRRATS